MKHTRLYKFILVFLMILGIANSCDDREIITADKGNAPILMDLSADTLFLDGNFPDNPALTVSWSAASYTVPTEIKYKVQASADKSFENPADLGSTDKSVRTTTFTVAQMNTAAKEIGLEAFVPSKMYLRVIATVGTGDLPQTSNATEITITPYKLVYPDFYLVGAASYVGWDAGQAQLLYKSENLSYMYTYLEGGQNFRFLGQKDWSPINYSIDQAGTKEAYRYFRSTGDNIVQAPGDDENMQFTGETGIYKIVINADKSVQSLRATASPIPGFDFPNLYVVGTLNGNNWDAATAIPMTKTSVGTYELVTTLQNAEQFKFLGQLSFGDLDWGNITADGNTGYLGPKGDNGNILFDGGGDTYKITVNLKAGIYSIVKQ